MLKTKNTELNPTLKLAKSHLLHVKTQIHIISGNPLHFSNTELRKVLNNNSSLQ